MVIPMSTELSSEAKRRKKQIHIRVKPNIYAALERQARRERRRSVADLMVAVALDIAERGLEAEERDG